MAKVTSTVFKPDEFIVRPSYSTSFAPCEFSEVLFYIEDMLPLQMKSLYITSSRILCLLLVTFQEGLINLYVLMSTIRFYNSSNVFPGTNMQIFVLHVWVFSLLSFNA